MLNKILILKTNWLNVIARIFIVILVIGLDFLFIKQIENNTRDHKILIFVFVFTLLLATIVSSFFGILKVQVNKETETLTLKRLFSSYTYNTREIKGFFTTCYRGRLKTWRGLILKTNDNKSYKLRQQNLKSIRDLKQYLTRKGILNYGEKIVGPIF